MNQKDEKSKFTHDFIAYWKQLRNYKKKNSKLYNNNIIKLCKAVWNNFTRPFMEKWSSNENLLTVDKYSEVYHSFLFTPRPDWTMLIPYNLFIYDLLKQENDMIESLENVTNYKQFIFALNRNQRNLNLKLSRKDIAIIRYLISDEFFGKTELYPSIQEFCNILKIKRTSFNRHINYLKFSSILNRSYRIDTSRLGYETIATITPVENDIGSISKYILAKVPLPSINNKEDLIIWQFPYHQNQVYKRIRNFSKKFFQLTNQYVGYNCTGLDPEPQKRWKVVPPILLSNDWSESLISPPNGVILDLNPLIEEKVTPAELKALTWYEKFGSINLRLLAQNRRLSYKSMIEVFSEILRKKQLYRFVSLSNIGLTYRPWFFIMTDKSYYNKIIEHLKFFPFSMIYYSKTEPFIITGLLHLPLDWVIDFQKCFTVLNDLNFTSFIDNLSFSRITRLNINISETYDPLI